MAAKKRSDDDLYGKLMADVASGEMKRNEGKPLQSISFRENCSYEFLPGAPEAKDIPGIEFSALMAFVDDNDKLHCVENFYEDSGIRGIKIPGGGAQEVVLQDNLFQATLTHMLLVWHYSPAAIKEVQDKLSLWNENSLIPHRMVLRAACMEYVEETGFFPDILDIVCHGFVQGGRGRRLMFLVKARVVYKSTKNGLERVEDLTTCGSGKSPLDLKVSQSVLAVPLNESEHSLSSKAHQAMVPLLRAFKRPARA